MCYNWEYACEEILANNYVSIFNSHDFFIQIIYCLHLKAPEAYLEPCQTSVNFFFGNN